MLVKEQCSDEERKDIFLKDKLFADTKKKIARQRKKEERQRSLKESSFNDTALLMIQLYYIISAYINPLQRTTSLSTVEHY